MVKHCKVNLKLELPAKITTDRRFGQQRFLETPVSYDLCRAFSMQCENSRIPVDSPTTYPKSVSVWLL